MVMKGSLILACLLTWAATAQPLTTQSIKVNDKHFLAIKAPADNISLHWKNNQGIPYRYFSRLKNDLKRQGKTVLALMNAGIYSQNDQPAGLHIESGKQQQPLNNKKGKGNFHLQPNGVFLITQKNQAAILSTKTYQSRYKNLATDIRLATQSGPLLLIDGKINPRFIAHSTSYYSRNAVCITAKGEIWFIITAAYEKTNFYTFALASKQLGCHQALYLDGSLSKLYQRGGNPFHFGHFVGILAITE